MAAATLAVSVFVIVWTATGAPPPIGTPPTWICRAEAMRPSVLPSPPRLPCLRARFTGRLRDRPGPPAGPRRRPARGPRARAPPRALLRPDRRAARHDRRRRRLRVARPAGVRARPRHHRGRSEPAPRLPGPVRPGRRDGAPPLRRRPVRPRLLL